MQMNLSLKELFQHFSETHNHRDIILHIVQYLNGEELLLFLSRVCRNLYTFLCKEKLHLWMQLVHNLHIIDLRYSRLLIQNSLELQFKTLAQFLSFSLQTIESVSSKLLSLDTITTERISVWKNLKNAQAETNQIEKLILEEGSIAYQYLYFKFSKLQKWKTKANCQVTTCRNAIKTPYATNFMHLNDLCILPKWNPIQAKSCDTLQNKNNAFPKETFSILTDTQNTYSIASFLQNGSFHLLRNHKTIKVFQGHSQSVVEVTPMLSNPHRTNSNLLIKNVQPFQLNLQSETESLQRMVEQYTFANSSSLFNNRLLSCSSDCTLKIWNFETTQCMATLNGHFSPVNSAKVSVDCRIACSVSHSGELICWDISTTLPIMKQQAHSSVIYQIEYDGYNTLGTCSRDGKVKIWDLRFDQKSSVKELMQLPNLDSTVEQSSIYSMAMQGYQISFGQRNGNVSFYDLRKSVTPVKQYNMKDVCTNQQIYDSVSVTQIRMDEVKCVVEFDGTKKLAIFDCSQGLYSHITTLHNDSLGTAIALGYNFGIDDNIIYRTDSEGYLTRIVMQ